jgi:predicted acetyltransferase
MIRIDRLKNIDELNDAIALANSVFFSGKKFFDQRYPHVFSQNNISWLFGLWDDERLVSFVATYPAKLLFQPECVIDTASLGVVCSAVDVQGKGYSSSLLSFVIDDLTKRDIELLMISGEGKLYQRLGAVTSGHLFEIHLPYDQCKRFDHDLFIFNSLKDFPMHDLLKWANSQCLPHFIRTSEEWTKMMEGHLANFELEETFLVMDFIKETFVAIKVAYEGKVKIAYLVDGIGAETDQWRILQDQAIQHQCDKAFARFTEALKNYDNKKISITGTMKILNPIKKVNCSLLASTEIKDITTLFSILPSFKIDNFNFL